MVNYMSHLPLFFQNKWSMHIPQDEKSFQINEIKNLTK